MTTMKDLTIITQPSSILGNYDEVKAQLEKNIATYDIDVNEDNLAEAKIMIKDLNRVKKQMERKRIDKAKEADAQRRKIAMQIAMADTVVEKPIDSKIYQITATMKFNVEKETTRQEAEKQFIEMLQDLGVIKVLKVDKIIG